jgi:hypothetical protein
LVIKTERGKERDRQTDKKTRILFHKRKRKKTNERYPYIKNRDREKKSIS